MLINRLIQFYIFYFLIISNSFALSTPIVSVRIGKSLKSIVVSGFDLKRNLIFNNDVRKYNGKQTVKFNCQTFTSLNKERNKPMLLATLESSTGLLSFESEKYHGQFKVITSPRGDSCDIVNEVPMETYISTLLTKEMNPLWPLEALKAQAVAARTYALHKMRTGQVSKELGSEAFYDLESSEKHQVGGTFFDATKTTIMASNDTNGEVLLNELGEIQPIFFHAKCGGKTLRPDQVWKNREESYESVNCPFCNDLGPKNWEKIISMDRMRSFIKWSIEKKYLDNFSESNFTSLIIVPDSMDKYTLNFYINDRPYRIEKGLLRNYFGRFLFPSNNFQLKANGVNFEVVGEGLGHNVGLCQTGAFALAKRGWSYKKILAHYFPKHQLKKVY
jgi:stage II sporulation protein D